MVDVRCRKCRRVLGRSNGREFFAGAIVFALPVTFACVECGKRRVWVPGKALPETARPREIAGVA